MLNTKTKRGYPDWCQHICHMPPRKMRLCTCHHPSPIELEKSTFVSVYMMYQEKYTGLWLFGVKFTLPFHFSHCFFRQLSICCWVHWITEMTEWLKENLPLCLTFACALPMHIYSPFPQESELWRPKSSVNSKALHREHTLQCWLSG